MLGASDTGNLVANYFDDLTEVTTYEYAAFNTLYRTVDGAGNAQLSVPDRYGRVELTDDLDRGARRNLFTAFGEVTSTTTDDGIATAFTYDALGRIRTLQNSVDGLVEWFYDHGADGNLNDVGKLVEVVRYQEGHSEQYRYQPYAGVNNRGLIEEVTRKVHTLKNPNNEEVVRSHVTLFERDPGSGLVTVAHLPHAGSTQSSAVLNLVYGYDEHGYLESVSTADGLGDSQDPLFLWQRLDLHFGALVSEFALGGHVEGTGTIRGTVDFDPVTDEILGLQYADFADSTAIVEGTTYTYDDNGNLKTTSRHNGNSEIYGYDSLNRLTGVVTTSGLGRDISYDYDSIGNIETVTDSVTGTMTYDYDHAGGSLPHAVRVAGDYEFEYTVRGGVSTRTNISTDTQQTFDYMGAFDLPKRIETLQGGEIATVAELEYSPLGERVVKRTFASDNSILSEIQYIGDDFEIHHHPDDSYEYVYNVFVGGSQIARVTVVEQTPGGGLSDPAVEFLLTDKFGTPRTVVDDEGEVLRSLGPSPTPFGRMIPPVGPGFTGHRHDEDLELIDMRGRLYDPAVARFMQADPIITAPYFSEGLNPYSYTFNSPTNWTDPTGLWVENPDGSITICGSGSRCPEEPDPQPQPLPPPGQGPRSSNDYRANSPFSEGNPLHGYPTGAGQWGPGNTPGDISPSQRNEFGELFAAYVQSGQFQAEIDKQVAQIAREAGAPASEVYLRAKERLVVGLASMFPPFGVLFGIAGASDSTLPPGERALHAGGAVLSGLPLLGVLRGGKGGVSFFHGTDIGTAERFLAGEGLEAAEAAARSNGARPGFYLATDVADATHFAYTRAPGGVVEFRLSGTAYDQLVAAGAETGPIAPGAKGFPIFAGQQFVIL